MRELILLGAAMIALSGCNDEPTADERAAAEQNVTSEVVATKDTTAIDAATGQAANMAADVTFMPEGGNELDGNETDGNAAQPAGERPRASPTPRERPRRPAPPPRENDDRPEADTL